MGSVIHILPIWYPNKVSGNIIKKERYKQ